MTPGDYTRFCDAFGSHIAHLHLQCACGRTFYDDTSVLAWAAGDAPPAAAPAGGPVETVLFEGQTFAACCDCWHEAAGQVIKLFEGEAAALADRHESSFWITDYAHGRQFMAYLRLAHPDTPMRLVAFPRQPAPPKPHAALTCAC